jgi:tRNA-dihydrouridine synthase
VSEEPEKQADLMEKWSRIVDPKISVAPMMDWTDDAKCQLTQEVTSQKAW